MPRIFAVNTNAIEPAKEAGKLSPYERKRININIAPAKILNVNPLVILLRKLSGNILYRDSRLNCNRYVPEA